VVPVGVERNLVSAGPLGDDREQGAPQDREAARQQDQVVEQEARFARDDGFQFRFGLQVIETVENQVDGGRDAEREEGDEVLSDLRAGKGMDRLHDARSGEESAENAEEEGGGN